MLSHQKSTAAFSSCSFSIFDIDISSLFHLSVWVDDNLMKREFQLFFFFISKQWVQPHSLNSIEKLLIFFPEILKIFMNKKRF